MMYSMTALECSMLKPYIGRLSYLKILVSHVKRLCQTNLNKIVSLKCYTQCERGFSSFKTVMSHLTRTLQFILFPPH